MKDGRKEEQIEKKQRKNKANKENTKVAIICFSELEMKQTIAHYIKPLQKQKKKEPELNKKCN